MSQRKRATGFTLMDAAFAADAKFVRLARKADNPVAFAAAVGVYWLLLADCRRARSPFVDWDDYTEYSEPILQLQAADLLTDSGFAVDSFERWAPAYRSVSERTGGTNRDGQVQKGTESTLASGHISSSQVPSAGTYSARANAANFMGFRAKASDHFGQHPGCLVCAPLQEKKS